MAKSYKVTFADKFDDSAFGEKPFAFELQMQIEGTKPGPQTQIHRSYANITFRDFQPYDIQHEYDVHMWGRLYDDEKSFSKFIARSEIRAYHSKSERILLLCGKKADILDFCKKTEDFPHIKLRTMQIDMKQLQERLPEVRGAWFRFRAGYIRAKAYMGQQIQDTPEYRDATNEGDISTLSFYFEDSRSGAIHPIQITEDGAIVLQKNYGSIEDELDFVLHVKNTLLEGIYSLAAPARSRRGGAEMPRMK
ncbi:MAG TPA: hypothetical protein VN948_17400 [Terriglobales bacterium]|nr:hypothetical protein [Terriglobales bacterium]